MDIAAVISELLEHQETLVVPGLGTFYRSRLDGYFSKEHQQFFPPSLQLQFNTELQEDDGKLLAAMIADKQVNPSSAKYFLEKYVAGLLHLASTETVAMGELGTFSVRRNQLIFIPKKLNNNNELFYGLAPVRLRRNKYHLAADAASKKPVQVPLTEKPSAFTAALLRGEPMPGKPLTTVDEAEEEETETTAKKPARIGTWILVLALIILVSGIGLILAYRYNPPLFDRFRGQNETPPVSDHKRERQISDSIQHAIEAQKNLGLTPAPLDSNTKSKILAPEAPRDTFGIVIGKFGTLAGAKKEMDRYSYARVLTDIHVNPDGTANPYQLTVATYLDVDSAKKHIDEFKVKLKLQDVFIQQYPYKKPQ